MELWRCLAFSWWLRLTQMPRFGLASELEWARRISVQLQSALTATTRITRMRARLTDTTDRLGLTAACLSALVPGSTDTMAAAASTVAEAITADAVSTVALAIEGSQVGARTVVAIGHSVEGQQRADQ